MKKLLISPWVLWSLVIALVVILSVVLYKAVPSEDSPAGFVLPPGDPLLGQEAFVDLGCVNCHTVYGVEFENVQIEDQLMTVPLGGEVLVAKTYGQLTTDIIHPPESMNGADSDDVQADGSPLMPQYQKDMTVEQLTNLVHFLREHYEMRAPDYSYYNYNYMDYRRYPIAP